MTRTLQRRSFAPQFQLPRNPDGSINADDIARLAEEFAKVQSLLRGGLSLGDGTSSSLSGAVRGQYIDYYFSAGSTIYNIPHGLRRTPVGYFVVLLSQPAVIYDPNFGAGWGDLTISLSSSAGLVKAKLLVFA